jgi:DNA-binding transcriptional regulator YiaG
MKKPLTRKVAGRTLSTEVEVYPDPETGEEVMPMAELDRAHIEMAAQLAEDGPIDGESFAWMRRAISVQAKDLARLLGVTPETVSAWENGRGDVNRAAWFALSAMVMERGGRKVDLHERMRRLAG